MTYDSFLELIERTGKIKIRELTKIIEVEFSNAHDEDETAEFLFHIDDLIKSVCVQKQFEGNSDDFHNLSVVFAREDEYDYACQILEIGLKRYPYSVDLLADFLNYGIQCGKEEQCDVYYKKLCDVSDKWNWRAYQFSIDYLKRLMEINPKQDVQDLRKLVYDFVNNKPQREESYLAKARFLQDFGDKKTTNHPETYLSVLEFATSDECPVGRTPKCDLSLADYYYSQGKDLNKTLQIIERCKRNSVEDQFSINRNYVYLLSALCKMSLYYTTLEKGESPKAEEGSEKMQQVLRIYDDYHVAAVNRADSHVKKNKEIIEAFVRETGVPYPYDDDIEND